jgi:hypothetical protein
VGDLAQLDFDLECPCGKPPTHLIRIHAVDYCTPEEPEAEEFRCTDCVGGFYKMAAQLLHPAGRNHCDTCDLTFDSLSAIIVSLLPLPPKE